MTTDDETETFADANDPSAPLLIALDETDPAAGVIGGQETAHERFGPRHVRSDARDRYGDALRRHGAVCDLRVPGEQLERPYVRLGCQHHVRCPSVDGNFHRHDHERARVGYELRTHRRL